MINVLNVNPTLDYGKLNNWKEFSVEITTGVTAEEFASNLADFYRKTVNEPDIVAKKFETVARHSGSYWGISNYKGQTPLYIILDQKPEEKKSIFLLERFFAEILDTNNLVQLMKTPAVSPSSISSI